MTREQSTPPQRSTPPLPPALTTTMQDHRASPPRQQQHRGAFPPAAASVAALPSPIGSRVSWDRFAGQVCTCRCISMWAPLWLRCTTEILSAAAQWGLARENRILIAFLVSLSRSMWEDPCFAAVKWTCLTGPGRRHCFQTIGLSTRLRATFSLVCPGK